MRVWVIWVMLGLFGACTKQPVQDTDTDTDTDIDTDSDIDTDTRAWPGERWDEAAPEEYGMDSAALEGFAPTRFDPHTIPKLF